MPSSTSCDDQTVVAEEEDAFAALMLEAEAAEKAGALDLAKSSGSILLWENGRDVPVITVIGARLLNKSADKHAQLHNIQLWFLLLLSRFREKSGSCQSQFILVYCHTNASLLSSGALEWLRNTYKVIPRRIRKSVQRFFIVHPSIWVRSIVGLASAFVSAKFFKKLVYVESMLDLAQSITFCHVKDIVPLFVWRYNLPSSPLFGSTLQSALERSPYELPTPLHVCSQWILKNGLYTEGIFRVPGETRLIAKKMRQFENNADEFDVQFENAHVCAGVLKKYLAQLEPEGLLPSSHHEPFLAIGELDISNHVEAFASFVRTIPQPNRFVLGHTIRLLRSVADASEQNKMDSKNLAIVFSPTLIRVQSETQELLISQVRMASATLQLLIEHATRLDADLLST